MKYFFKITEDYSQKNKLYQALFDHVKALDASLINGTTELYGFRNAIMERAKELNSEFPRCKPLAVDSTHGKSYLGPEEVHGSSLYVIGSWKAQIYPVKNYVNTVNL